MRAIQLLYAKNIIVRHEGIAHQHLAFTMTVEHLALEKTVEVFWAGEDGVWRVLPAEYRASTGQNREIWCADAFFHLAAEDDPCPAIFNSPCITGPPVKSTGTTTIGAITRSTPTRASKWATNRRW